MRKVNLKDVAEKEKQSPKGRFHRFTKNISIALGREPESLDLAKRHPFDLALVRITKGKSLCPYHSHSAESELYLVVSGRGSVRDKDRTTEVGPGDAFLFQPGEAHQLTNAGWKIRRFLQRNLGSARARTSFARFMQASPIRSGMESCATWKI